MRAYQAAMRSDLRNIVAAQEAFFADSARFADVQALTARGDLILSTGVAVDSSHVTADAFSVRLVHEGLGDAGCSITYARASPEAPAPSCELLDEEKAHITKGAIYAGSVLIALGILLWQSLAARLRVVPQRYLFVVVLAVAHPFWGIIEGHLFVWCRTLPFEEICIGLAAATAFFFIYDPPEARQTAAKPRPA